MGADETVGLDGTERLATLARAHDVAFVDVPVLGTKAPAEQGKLTVLAAGPRCSGPRWCPCSTRSARRRLGGRRPGAGTG